MLRIEIVSEWQNSSFFAWMLDLGVVVEKLVTIVFVLQAAWQHMAGKCYVLDLYALMGAQFWGSLTKGKLGTQACLRPFYKLSMLQLGGEVLRPATKKPCVVVFLAAVDVGVSACIALCCVLQ